jgi:poly-gamma-glutamate synthesis protein (capsule biosynthesis protein)
VTVFPSQADERQSDATSAPRPPIRLLAVGDSNVQRPAGARPFAKVAGLLGAADLRFAQLEGPIAEASLAGRPGVVAHKPGWVHSTEADLAGFAAAGFDVLSTASNVAYPGPLAAASAARVAAAGLLACGAGASEAEARAPARLTRGGVRFGFLSRTSVFWPYGHAASPTEPGVATLRAHTAYQPGRRTPEMPGAEPTVVTWADPESLEALCADITALRGEVDVLVVACHWGVSGALAPIDYQRQAARAMIAAGADLIVGHHPHKVQGCELIDGRAVFYSLGNFAFDWAKMRGRDREGLAVEAECDTQGISRIEIRAVCRDADNDIAPATPEEAQAILEQVARASEVMGTRLALGDGHAVLEGIAPPPRRPA